MAKKNVFGPKMLPMGEEEEDFDLLSLLQQGAPQQPPAWQGPVQDDGGGMSPPSMPMPQGKAGNPFMSARRDQPSAMQMRLMEKPQQPPAWQGPLQEGAPQENPNDLRQKLIRTLSGDIEPLVHLGRFSGVQDPSLEYLRSNFPMESKALQEGSPFQVDEALGKVYRTAGSPRAKHGEVMALLAKMKEMDPEGSKPPGLAPPSAPPGMGVGGGAAPQQQGQEQELPFRERMRQDPAIGRPEITGIAGNAMSAAQELAQKYSAQMKTEADAVAALKAEFEDTPELDEAIMNAQAQLMKVQGDRKQPGFFDFIALAMMNLSGMDPRVAAESVLGTGKQEQRENQLQDYLNNLEVKRAGDRSGGRRQYQKAMFDRGDLEAQLGLRREVEGAKLGQQQEMMGFRKGKLSIDKLMQRRGQITNQLGTMPSADERKKLLGELDAIDKLIQPQAQPEQPPQDKRQSRMFGGLAQGSFA